MEWLCLHGSELQEELCVAMPSHETSTIITKMRLSPVIDIPFRPFLGFDYLLSPSEFLCLS